jgi:hypothetical protein
MSRARKHIRLGTKLAAALACLLPQDQRDDLRRRQVHEDEVLALFEFDHLGLHALMGSDEWWNLDPKLERPHREKSGRDTSIVAKVNRIRASASAVAGAPKVARPPRRRRTRKIPARRNPWPSKGSRPFRWHPPREKSPP